MPMRGQMMLATEFNHYEKGPLLNSQLETLLGVGVFNSDGEWLPRLASLGGGRLTSSMNAGNMWK